METWDAIVIGAGPAGLTAAAYLARFRRRVVVLDGGPSRAHWIPESHNTPGFPRGVGGPALISRLTAQAERFGAARRPGLATGLRVAEGFTVETLAGALRAPTVLLATGVLDRLPPIHGLGAAIRAGLVRMCPICDGYEAISKRIAVLGPFDLAAREAEFLRTYSRDVTVLRLVGADHGALESEDSQHLNVADIAFSQTGVHAFAVGRPVETFDHLYLALGCLPQSRLASGCGAAVDGGGAVRVDPHQMTTVAGLYAAGDLVRGLNQIAVASGEAAIAATAMHNRLREGPEPL